MKLTLINGLKMNINEFMVNYDPSKWSEISEMLVQAKADVSFWGGRIITVESYEGSILIDRVAGEMRKALLNSFDTKDKNFGLEQRLAGIEISKKLAGFYLDSDELIEKANWFTWILAQIWEKALGLFDDQARNDIQEGYLNNYLRAYTKESFKEQFGQKPIWGSKKIADDNAANIIINGCSDWFVAKEEDMKKQYNELNKTT